MSPGFPFLVLVMPFAVTLIVLLIFRRQGKMESERFRPMVLGLAVLTVAAIVLASKVARDLNEAKNYSFSGVIEKAYSEEPKKIPHIIVNGIDYDLGSLTYSDFDSIKAGDSAKKKKGTFELKFIKRKKSPVSDSTHIER